MNDWNISGSLENFEAAFFCRVEQKKSRDKITGADCRQKAPLKLDFSFIYEEVEELYSEKGRPCIRWQSLSRIFLPSGKIM